MHPTPHRPSPFDLDLSDFITPQRPQPIAAGGGGSSDAWVSPAGYEDYATSDLTPTMSAGRTTTPSSAVTRLYHPAPKRRPQRLSVAEAVAASALKPSPVR